MTPLSVQAGLWGLLSGSALLIGAAIGWFVTMPRKAVAAIMAFGSGVLISALSFKLMDEAWKQGGFFAVGVGFIAGAMVYTVLNMALAARGARHRRRSDASPGGSMRPLRQRGIVRRSRWALIDGVPESIVIGTSPLAGGAIGWVAVAAVFLSKRRSDCTFATEYVFTQSRA